MEPRGGDPGPQSIGELRDGQRVPWAWAAAKPWKIRRVDAAVSRERANGRNHVAAGHAEPVDEDDGGRAGRSMAGDTDVKTPRARVEPRTTNHF